MLDVQGHVAVGDTRAAPMLVDRAPRFLRGASCAVETHCPLVFISCPRQQLVSVAVRSLPVQHHLSCSTQPAQIYLHPVSSWKCE